MNNHSVSKGKEQRIYGVDLYKTVAMFMVLVLHILGQGGVLKNTAMAGANYWAGWTLGAAAFCAVDCFALATGYLMTGRPFRYRKIVPLWLTVFFYSVLFLAVGAIFVPGSTKMLDFIGILPVTSKKYWYFSSYFILFLFIPFLNILVERLPKRQFFILLLTGFCLFSGSILIATDLSFSYLSEGYSPWWLMYLYILGAGIKKYDLFRSVSARKAFVGYLVMVILTLGIKGATWFIGSRNIPLLSKIFELYGHNRFVSYLSPTIVAASVFLMLFCLRITVPRWMRKPLGWLAPLIFQVYIIHQNPLVRDYFLRDRFAGLASHSPVVMVLLTLGAAAGIFTACILIDWLRSALFRLLKVNKLADRLVNRMAGVFGKFEERNGSLQQ